jgi:hypothetical protein
LADWLSPPNSAGERAPGPKPDGAADWLARRVDYWLESSNLQLISIDRDLRIFVFLT